MYYIHAIGFYCIKCVNLELFTIESNIFFVFPNEAQLGILHLRSNYKNLKIFHQGSGANHAIYSKLSNCLTNAFDWFWYFSALRCEQNLSLIILVVCTYCLSDKTQVTR